MALEEESRGGEGFELDAMYLAFGVKEKENESVEEKKRELVPVVCLTVACRM